MTNTYKRKKLSFDKAAYTYQYDLILSAVERASAGLEAFTALGVLKPNDEIFKYLVSNNFAPVEALQISEIRLQLQTAHITVTAIANAAIEKAINAFREDVQPLFENLRRVYREQLPYVTFQNGAATFSKDSNKLLEERYSVYCSSVEAENLISLHAQLANTMTKIKQVTRVTDVEMAGLLQGTIKYVRETDIYEPVILNYDLMVTRT